MKGRKEGKMEEREGWGRREEGRGEERDGGWRRALEEQGPLSEGVKVFSQGTFSGNFLRHLSASKDEKVLPLWGSWKALS